MRDRLTRMCSHPLTDIAFYVALIVLLLIHVASGAGR
jgi:hypothetical protein